MDGNETASKQKKQTQFCCTTCDFTCSKKSNYEAHLLTRKHAIETNSKHENDNNIIYKCDCKEVFNSRTTLWRHKKKCTTLTKAEATEKAEFALKITELENAIPNMDMNLIFAFMKDTQEFKQMVFEQSKIITDLV